MKRIIFIKIILIILINVFSIKEALSWEPTVTHRDFSLYATENSVISEDKGDYLKNLGFENGINERFEWNGVTHKAKDWITNGANLEDSARWWEFIFGDSRSENHFHDPLKAWLDAGLNDIKTGESSLWWAQNSTEQGNYREGDWSWRKVREKYYYALIAVTDEDRQMNFAQTFRGLGHQMHLIQDAAQPDHVRNDIHPGDNLGWTYSIGFEKWTAETLKSLSDLKAFAPTLQFPEMSFDPSQYTLDASYYDRNLAPSALLLDTDQYDKDTPSDFFTTGLATSLTIGIAEYTNANFVSDNTILTEELSVDDKHYFSYPRRSSTDLQSFEDEGKLPETATEIDGIPDTGFWISKTGDGEKIVHFLKPRYFTRNSAVIAYSEDLYRRTFYRDKKCHEDYAKLLIPRAVGYSAGLLNYFFRGELYVAFLVPSVDEISLGFGNKNDTGSDIDRVGVHIQSNSKLNGVIEPVGAGTLTLTVSYKDSSDSIIYESAGSVSVTSIPDVESTSYIANVFILTNPIPTLTATDVTYYFVFRGQLGNEEDAVIGKVIKAPVLHSVSPDEGLLGDVVTLTGNNLPTIDGPFPTISDDVRFSHNVTSLYEVEVINKTDTDITVKVPNTAGLNKPGYGGLRLRNILDTGEKIYSNPVLFFPIAEGGVRNIGPSIINVTIAAIGPINGDYSQLPGTITIDSLGPGASEPIQLMTGFTYKATANTTVTKDIEFLTVDTTVFVFEVE